MNEPDIPFSKAYEDTAAKALALYQKARYEKARGLLHEATKIDPRGELCLLPYVKKCNRVIGAKPIPSVQRQLKEARIRRVAALLSAWAILIGFYLLGRASSFASDENAFHTAWKAIRVWFSSVTGSLTVALFVCLVYSSWKLFASTDPVSRWRCKYCGHCTPYVDPEEPGYGGTFGSNFCHICHRSYPMPDVFWDGWDGLEYMSGRHSVYEQEFYDDYLALMKAGEELQEKLHFPSSGFKSREAPDPA